MILECRDSQLDVAEVAVVIAVGETRGEFSQVVLPNWITAQGTKGLRVGCPAVDQDEFHLSPPAAWLRTDLFNANRRKVARRRNVLNAARGDHSENENRDDLKCRVFRSRRRKLAPADIGHPGNYAGCRVVLRGVDLLGGALRV